MLVLRGQTIRQRSWGKPLPFRTRQLTSLDERGRILRRSAKMSGPARSPQRLAPRPQKLGWRRVKGLVAANDLLNSFFILASLLPQKLSFRANWTRRDSVLVDVTRPAAAGVLPWLSKITEFGAEKFV